MLRLPLAYLIAGTTAILATLSNVPAGEPQGKTSTTGGIMTTGSTGSGGGFASSGNYIYISNLTEHKSASTYGYFSGSWQQLTGRHTAGIEFTSTPWTFSGTPPSNVSSITHSETIFVEQGTEVSAPSGTSLGTDTATGGVVVAGGFVPTGNLLYIQTSDTGAIPSGRHLAYWIKTATVTTYNDGTPTSSSTSWSRSEVVLVKLGCQDASVDTRKTYGQPNKAGEFPADPNARLRNVNFGPWDYKGGIFIGNMTGGGTDASGTARTQLYVQGGSTYDSNYYFAALSLLDMGKPSSSSISGSVDTGVYFPSSSDTNLSVGESTVTWSTMWGITPGSASSSTDYTLHPFVHQTLANGSSDDYLVFRLTGVAGTSKPDMALHNICLAIVDEASAGGNIWHYFASREYQDSGSSFPRNDCAPRVWLITAP